MDPSDYSEKLTNETERYLSARRHQVQHLRKRDEADKILDKQHIERLSPIHRFLYLRGWAIDFAKLFLEKGVTYTRQENFTFFQGERRRGKWTETKTSSPIALGQITDNNEIGATHLFAEVGIKHEVIGVKKRNGQLRAQESKLNTITVDFFASDRDSNDPKAPRLKLDSLRLYLGREYSMQHGVLAHTPSQWGDLTPTIELYNSDMSGVTKLVEVLREIRTASESVELVTV